MRCDVGPRVSPKVGSRKKNLPSHEVLGIMQQVQGTQLLSRVGVDVMGALGPSYGQIKCHGRVQNAVARGRTQPPAYQN